MDGHVGSRHGHSRDEQRGSGGEVPGDLDLAKREAVGLLDGDALRAAADSCARTFEQAFGVIPRGQGLDDGRLPIRMQAGEEHGGLHLRRGYRQLVVDCLQEAAFDDQRCVTVGGLDMCSHAQ